MSKIFSHRRFNPRKNLPTESAQPWGLSRIGLSSPEAENRAARQTRRSQQALQRSRLGQLRACQRGAPISSGLLWPGCTLDELELAARLVLAAKCVGGTRDAVAYVEGTGCDPMEADYVVSLMPITLDAGLMRQNWFALALDPTLRNDIEERLSSVRAARIEKIKRIIEEHGYFKSASERKPFTSIEEALSTPWFSMVVSPALGMAINSGKIVREPTGSVSARREMSPFIRQSFEKRLEGLQNEPLR